MLTVERVCYGKAATKKEDREYRMLGNSAVGTIVDWLSWAKSNKILRVKFMETDYEFIINS